MTGAPLQGWPQRLVVRPLTVTDARRIARWRYAGPWSAYDSHLDDGLLSDVEGYLAVAGPGGPLVGFCCSSQEALVPGLTAAEQGMLDLGVGVTRSVGFAEVGEHVRQDGRDVSYTMLKRPRRLSEDDRTQ